jgi:hypothetical protein
MHRWIVSACFVLGVARFVAADTGYDLKREIAWARLRWPGDLDGVRFGVRTEKLLAWVPPGASIDAWAYSPMHSCDLVKLHRISEGPAAIHGHDLLVGESIVYTGVDHGREVRAWKSFSFGVLFSEAGEALSREERNADGTWVPMGQTGTIGLEDATYGVLSYVDANVARFGGTHLVLYAECDGPVAWLKCTGGGERPCVGCKKVLVSPEEADAHYDGLGFMWGRRKPTCNEACPNRPPNPAIARLDELQSHVTIWRPSREPLAETPSLHRTLADCMRTHYPNGPPPRTMTRVKP